MDYKKQLAKWAKQRATVLFLRETGKLSFGEIGKKLGCTPQNARILYEKAKKENGTDSDSSTC